MIWNQMNYRQGEFFRQLQKRHINNDSGTIAKAKYKTSERYVIFKK